MEKFGGSIGNDPGAIAHELALILREPVIAPIMAVDIADGTKVARLLQLMSETGSDRDKAQDMHMLWGVDREK